MPPTFVEMLLGGRRHGFRDAPPARPVRVGWSARADATVARLIAGCTLSGCGELALRSAAGLPPVPPTGHAVEDEQGRTAR